MSPIPHPIPYQGSKRQLAARILECFPDRVDTLLEPFCGSAAISLAAAQRAPGLGCWLNDSLLPLAALWRQIVAAPEHVADGYAELWRAQADDPRGYYDQVREAFNRDGDPVKLLFLLARCVKNAVRFNAAGQFNQSPDRRRRGTRPETMRRNLLGASRLLATRTRVSSLDYAELLGEATPHDLVYLDPPYQGTSGDRDSRYHQPLDRLRFIRDLERLRRRGGAMIIRFDGRSGERRYGPELPAELGLVRLELPAGRSSQATLSGRAVETVESLYLSPELAGRARWASAAAHPRTSATR